METNASASCTTGRTSNATNETSAGQNARYVFEWSSLFPFFATAKSNYFPLSFYTVIAIDQPTNQMTVTSNNVGNGDTANGNMINRYVTIFQCKFCMKVCIEEITN